MKKVLIALSILLVMALCGIGFLKYNIKQTKLHHAAIEEVKVINTLKSVIKYETDGEHITLYVNNKWLDGTDTEHIDWCRRVGLAMDEIYHEYVNTTFNAYVHVYYDNNNGTVTKLAWYKGNGEVELYYKH